MKVFFCAFALVSSLAFGFETVSLSGPKVQVSAYKAKNYYHLLGMKGFSNPLLTQHFKLYEGYVAQTNLLQEKMAALIDANLVKSTEYAGIKKMFAFEYDGMKLHEFYFENLGGKSSINIQSNLYKKIVQDFGSFDKWKADFQATGLLRGIGWVILYFDALDNRLVNAWIESHEKGHLVHANMLLVMDVWEHAYITEYGLSKADYIEAFFSNIQWNIVVNRFDVAGR